LIAKLGKFPFENDASFWDLVSKLETMNEFLDTLHDLTDVQKSFFRCCFAKAENRSSASELLNHSYFENSPELGADGNNVSKGDSDVARFFEKCLAENPRVSIALTTDDVNEAAFALLKLRAKKSLSLSAKSSTVLSEQKKINPFQMKKMAKNLNIFPAAVESSFAAAVKTLESDFLAFEKSPSPTMRTRKLGRRRRTFVGETPGREKMVSMSISAASQKPRKSEPPLPMMTSSLTTNTDIATEMAKDKIDIIDTAAVLNDLEDMSKLIALELNDDDDEPKIQIKKKIGGRRRRTFDTAGRRRKLNIIPPPLTKALTQPLSVKNAAKDSEQANFDSKVERSKSVGLTAEF